MNTLSRRCWTQVVVVALTLSCGASMRAAEQGSDYAEIDPNVDVRTLSNPDALRMAYGVLYMGNHNYNGHRVRAMKEIRNAATLLGVELKGDGHGNQPQDVSDAGFRLSERILREVRSRLTGDIQEHVNQALLHLSKGLQIRAIEDES